MTSFEIIFEPEDGSPKFSLTFEGSDDQVTALHWWIVAQGILPA